MAVTKAPTIGIAHHAGPTARDRRAARLAGSLVIPLGLAAVAFAVFLPALGNDFVSWDDYVNLVDNQSFRGLGWTHLRWMLTSTLMGHYIPLTWLTYALDHWLWGMNPVGYHLTNLLLHSANAALFYLVAVRLLARATAFGPLALRTGGIVAALFFAVHPLRAESVAWATERRDVLSGLFFLLTVLTYLLAAERNGRRRRALLLASVACFALALASKSIVMTLPLVLVVLDIYPLRRLSWRWGMWRDAATRTVLAEKLPYLVLGLAGAATSYWAVASNHFFTPAAKYGWPARLGIAAYSVWFYLEKSILPVALSPLYELPAVVDPLDRRFALAAVGVVAVTAALLALRRRWPAGLAVWAYYGIVLGPVSGLIHAGHQLAHDRYSYLSCLGWALLAGAAVAGVVRQVEAGTLRPWLGRAAIAVAAAWIIALASLTWHQVQIWRDTETLWQYAVDADPTCSICQGNLGRAAQQAGLPAAAKQHYEQALALRPDRVELHSFLGVVYDQMGDAERAVHHAHLAAQGLPNDPIVLTNVGYVLLRQGRSSEAIPYLERASRIDPNAIQPLMNLGTALLDTGQAQRAVRYLLRGVDLRPDEPGLRFNLVRAYVSLGRRDAARKHYDILVRLDPPRAQAFQPMFGSAP